MDIHGSDIFFENVKAFINEDVVVPIIKNYWPDLVYEAMVENGVLHLFIHPNQAAEEAWNEDGWSEENDTTLIYMIWNKIKCELTFVIDDFKKNKIIIDKVQEVLGF